MHTHVSKQDAYACNSQVGAAGAACAVCAVCAACAAGVACAVCVACVACEWQKRARSLGAEGPISAARLHRGPARRRRGCLLSAFRPERARHPAAAVRRWGSVTLGAGVTARGHGIRANGRSPGRFAARFLVAGQTGPAKLSRRSATMGARSSRFLRCFRRRHAATPIRLPTAASGCAAHPREAPRRRARSSAAGSRSGRMPRRAPQLPPPPRG